MKTEKRSVVMVDAVPRVKAFPVQWTRTGSPVPEPQPPVEQPTIQPSLELDKYTDSKVAEGNPERVCPFIERSVPAFPSAHPSVPENETAFRSWFVPSWFWTSDQAPFE
jgi:hypothetical protein